MSSMHTTTYFRMLIVLPFMHAMGGALAGCGEVAPAETQNLCTAECQTTYNDCMASLIQDAGYSKTEAAYACGSETSLPVCLLHCQGSTPSLDASVDAAAQV